MERFLSLKTRVGNLSARAFYVGAPLVAAALAAVVATAGHTAHATTTTSTSPTTSSTKSVTPKALALTVSSRALGPGIQPGFVGLATEYWNVEQEVGADPSKPDLAFEQVARNLAPEGGFSLRIGGDSTDWTWFPIPDTATPPWVRWTMTPTWAAVTKRLVSDLKAHLIVGLNMEADNLKVDDAEINEINSGIGGAGPITFELGNEPELYSHFPFYHDSAGAAVLGRPKSYSLQEMASQWNQIAKALPAERLAGPGYSSLSALPFVSGFLSGTKHLSLLTVHTYPLKSKRCNAGETLTEGDLFDQGSLEGLASGVNSWSLLAHKDGVGMRVDEINSVTCGGQPGFTGSFGPALWALNILPLYAADGINGVNFQTRPYTAQNLIQTDHKPGGWRVYVEPEYYGLLAFAQLTPPGSRILSTNKLSGGLLDWAVRTPKGQVHVVVTNPGNTTESVSIHAPGAGANATVETLRSSAGGLAAQSGITLGGQTVSVATGKLTGRLVTNTIHAKSGVYTITVPAASAQILTY